MSCLILSRGTAMQCPYGSVTFRTVKNSFSGTESHFELQSESMHSRIRVLLCLLALRVSGTAFAQQPSPSLQTATPANPPAAQQKKTAAPAAQTAPKPKPTPAP